MFGKLILYSRSIGFVTSGAIVARDHSNTILIDFHKQ